MSDRKIITVWANGGTACLGNYEADTEADALDQCARRNGYRSWADVDPCRPMRVFDENEPPTERERQQQHARRLVASARWNASRVRSKS